MRNPIRLPFTYKDKQYWKQIGRIQSADLRYEEHFDARFLQICFDLENGCQCFMGPIVCRNDDEFPDLTPAGRDWINKVKAVTGTRLVSEMEGKIVWVIYESEQRTMSGTIQGLTSLNLDKSVEPLIMSEWAEAWKDQ